MMLKRDDVVYALHKRNQISRVRFVRYTRRGTAAHFINEDDNSKPLILALWRLYATKEEAQADLQAKRAQKAKEGKQRQRERSEREAMITHILDKIFNEFGVRIRFLSRPHDEEEAWKLYRHIKQKHEEQAQTERA